MIKRINNTWWVVYQKPGVNELEYILSFPFNEGDEEGEQTARRKAAEVSANVELRRGILIVKQDDKKEGQELVGGTLPRDEQGEDDKVIPVQSRKRIVRKTGKEKSTKDARSNTGKQKVR